ncbi:MAG TPA: AraC family transcriptional regulator [Thermomicrobiales bacterium]|nr:AraC family transcriptional regulator [Thermomicrobiales bacterium]
MDAQPSGSGGEGLERSCEADGPDWIRQSDVVGGVELFEARLRRLAYRRHRHDVYAISLTEAGVQAFAYRGETHVSAPGQVVVLHPDEPHDGHAGAASGFGYRQLYVEPALIFDAVRSLTGRAGPLPFVREPVTTNPILATAIRAAFRDGLAPLAADDLIGRVAAGLLAADPSSGPAPRRFRLDLVAVDRARQLLDAETSRVVTSREMEAATGLSRFDLARQFRAVVGASPYRYSLMRRLAQARRLIACGRPLVDVALETGFADQAHFTRMFTAAFGMTPGQHRALTARDRQ